jgi:hypothetical protein
LCPVMTTALLVAARFNRTRTSLHSLMSEEHLHGSITAPFEPSNLLLQNGSINGHPEAGH